MWLRETVRIGIENAAAIDAIATYLLEKKNRIHTSVYPIRTSGKNDIMAPAEVAMPLPPLKPSQKV